MAGVLVGLSAGRRGIVPPRLLESRVVEISHAERTLQVNNVLAEVELACAEPVTVACWRRNSGPQGRRCRVAGSPLGVTVGRLERLRPMSDAIDRENVDFS